MKITTAALYILDFYTFSGTYALFYILIFNCSEMSFVVRYYSPFKNIMHLAEFYLLQFWKRKTEWYAVIMHF